VDVGQVTESLLQVPHQHTTPGNMVAWAGWAADLALARDEICPLTLKKSLLKTWG
jgi:hypothetical protein